MVTIKAFVTGLMGVSLGMANISGIVTDTGTTPITGAAVQLEKGGQTATTGSDGFFTLVVSTATLPNNSKSLPNGPSARITGNRLNVTVAERAVVEVSTYDLSGKVLSTVRKTLDAGNHSIALPLRGTGIYLYKVKSGNREFALKGNSVGGIASGSPVLSQGSLPDSPAKQARSIAAINDVIAAAKEGYLNYRCVIGNSDTSGIVVKMIANAGNVTDTDGNVYQTVKIGNQVWMVENLRVTKYNDGTPIPLDTSEATWRLGETAKYCYYNNTTNADSIKRFGALYNWYAVDTKKLAPIGWRVPLSLEWTIMENYLIANSYNWDGTTSGNKTGKALSAKTDWNEYASPGTIGNDVASNNKSGFSGLPGGIRHVLDDFNGGGKMGIWWSEDVNTNGYPNYWELNWSAPFPGSSHDLPGCGFSVRLIKD